MNAIRRMFVPLEKNLSHVGSFLGSEFKQFMQVLPCIIADEFTDPVLDKDILLLNESLSALGLLCSLVFVRQIEGGMQEPKVHCLHHLHEDIRRFGCALHFESEKGEMYNKFIREQLFHTNRNKPSFDVAIRFAKQESLKHITDDGGSWINKHRERVKYGYDIEKYIKSDETQFRQQFFDARELAENSYTAVTGSPKSGFKGVFMMTESAHDDGGCVEEYEVLSAEKIGRLNWQSTGRIHQKKTYLL